jgi:ABC-type phosphate transport system auxiliary subunit
LIQKIIVLTKMQPSTPQEQFSEGFIKRKELRQVLLEKCNKLAKKNDEIMGERLAKRSELQKALAAFDSETRALQLEADKETGYQGQIDTLTGELRKCEESLANTLEILEEEPPFSYTSQDCGIIIMKTIEKRSAGISLKSISQALVKAGTFKTATEAEQVIKAHNTVDTPVLKIKDSLTGQSLDLEKELPKPSKKRKSS